MSSSNPCVIGLNLGGHDGGAALITGTQMIAISEERLNRRRYSPGWQASLLYVLKAAGLTLADVDLVVASTYGMHQLTPAQTGLTHLGVPPERIRIADHHLSHAYSAYCLSSFEQATVLVCDGAGNNTDTETYYLATSGGIERLGGNDPARPRFGGIGATYEAVTEYLGWHAQEAGKTMALASFGDPGRFAVPLFDLTDDLHVVGRLPGGHARGVAAYAAQHGLNIGPADSKGEHPRGVDVAAYLQHQTEQILLALTSQLIKQTGVGQLCLAGGVALNCVANDKISKLGGVEDLFVPPPASDRGQALGCALYGWHQLTGQMPHRPLAADAFGRTYDEADIELALRRDPRSGLSERRHTPFIWTKESDIAATAAQLLANGSIIGWFTGASELGPRALGHRSILADPRTLASKQALNDRIKKREPFRPFAPAVLAEHVNHWFELAGPSPYMLLAPAVRAGTAEQIPAVVHVDQTARVQTVDAASQPAFAALLHRFHALTGIPMVLNTSFNDNEPIVETPADALATFQATDLDALCIGDYLVTKT